MNKKAVGHQSKRTIYRYNSKCFDKLLSSGIAWNTKKQFYSQRCNWREIR